MTATNHALSGALIGLVVTQPLLALPLAFVSHFALDMLPHFGWRSYDVVRQKSKFYRYFLSVDALLAALVVLTLVASNAPWLAIICVFVAGLPDAHQAYLYIFKMDMGKNTKVELSNFTKFHNSIQHNETPRGIYFEVFLAIFMAIVLVRIV